MQTIDSKAKSVALLGILIAVIIIFIVTFRLQETHGLSPVRTEPSHVFFPHEIMDSTSQFYKDVEATLVNNEGVIESNYIGYLYCSQMNENGGDVMDESIVCKTLSLFWYTDGQQYMYCEDHDILVKRTTENLKRWASQCQDGIIILEVD